MKTGSPLGMEELDSVIKLFFTADWRDTATWIFLLYKAKKLYHTNQNV